MGVAKIKVLNENEDEEQILFNITPKFFNNINGTHSFDYKNGIVVIDYAKNDNVKN